MKKSNITLESIYKQRFVVQDEDFSFELATKVFPELFWEDLDNAYAFIEGLLMIDSAINSVFSEKEKEEFEMYLYITKHNKIVIARSGDVISYKALTNSICIDWQEFTISEDGKKSLIDFFKKVRHRIYED